MGNASWMGAACQTATYKQRASRLVERVLGHPNQWNSGEEHGVAIDTLAPFIPDGTCRLN